MRDGEVSVRDHGPGIADSDLPYVFDRFYRAPAARGLPGSGLGLAIVRQVAESHGGAVVAERANGGGARMSLRLPVDGLASERLAFRAHAPGDHLRHPHGRGRAQAAARSLRGADRRAATWSCTRATS